MTDAWLYLFAGIGVFTVGLTLIVLMLAALTVWLDHRRKAEANQLVDERVREYQRRLWADGLDGAEVTHFGPAGTRKEKLS